MMLTAVNALGPGSESRIPSTCSESVPNPRHRTNLSPRLDYAVNKNNTLTARYQYFRDSQNNDGVGQFNLPPRATTMFPPNTPSRSAIPR